MRSKTDPVESVDYEVECIPFDYQGERFTVSVNMTHNLTRENVGIGWYEYWGHMENDDRTWLTSNFEDAEFGEAEIFCGNEDMPIANPSEDLLEAAHLAAFNSSYESVEERANDS